MNELKKDTKRNWWSISFKIIQVIFFFIIIVCTVYNLRISIRQTNLIFKPVIGVIGVNIEPEFEENKADIYENVENATITFRIKNTGNLPAKDFKVKTAGKLGNTTLPHTEDSKAGGILVQNVGAVNTTTISKEIIKKLVEEEERLIYTVQLSYSDWEDYEKYDYKNMYEIYLISKKPFKLGAKIILSE